MLPGRYWANPTSDKSAHRHLTMSPSRSYGAKSRYCCSHDAKIFQTGGTIQLGEWLFQALILNSLFNCIGWVSVMTESESVIHSKTGTPGIGVWNKDKSNDWRLPLASGSGVTSTRATLWQLPSVFRNADSTPLSIITWVRLRQEKELSNILGCLLPMTSVSLLLHAE